MDRKGFTLVEMFVVIVIVVILAAAPAILSPGLLERTKEENTRGLVQALYQACERYRQDFHTRPPAGPFSGSQNLHHHLERKVQIGRFGPGGQAKGVVEKGPYMDFKAGMLQGPKPSSVVDGFGRVIA